MIERCDQVYGNELFLILSPVFLVEWLRDESASVFIRVKVVGGRKGGEASLGYEGTFFLR
jgi:hypothetical protein